MTILPTILMNGQFNAAVGCRVPEIPAHRRRPQISRQMPTSSTRMRRFNEELRTALGVPTYYNEALGSTSLVSVYDRVKGRKGDNPDQTVGVKTGNGGH